MVSVSNNIHLTLKTLIDQKSKRDQRPFSACQLAKAIGMPHSMLVKLTHSDPSKRVNNPRIDTLSKIVKFFKEDGFDITIDDLLAGFKTTTIDVANQALGSFSVNCSLPVYDMHSAEQSGNIDIKLTQDFHHAIAFVSHEDIKPMFKKGSIFVIDTQSTPEDGTLVAARIDNQTEIIIRKYHQHGRKRLLKAFDSTINPIELNPTTHCQLFGVVVQINAKT